MSMGTSWRSLTHIKTLRQSSPSCEFPAVLVVALC